MFLPWETICCSKDSWSRRNYNERRLKFLKWMRDDLEAKLAGVNAAIETVERQVSEDEPSTSTSTTA